MNPTRRLPFTRLDAALLAIVVVLAVGSIVSADRERQVFGRWGIRQAPSDLRPWSRWHGWLRKAVNPARRVLDDTQAPLMVLSLGLALVAFRPRRGIGRGPFGAGPIASGVASLLVVFGLISIAKDAWIDQPIFRAHQQDWAIEDDGHFPPFWYWFDWAAPGTTIASAIVTAWIMLALVGRWEKPVDAHDRMGRCLGWGWIGFAVLSFFVKAVTAG